MDIEQYRSEGGSRSYQDSVLLWPTEKTLRHYGVVWEKQLTRSGMPRNNSGWKWLRSQGVKSIVTFRIENDVDYNKYGFERVLRIPSLVTRPAIRRATSRPKSFSTSFRIPTTRLFICTAMQEEIARG